MNGLVHAHSGIRWIILVGLILSIVIALLQSSKKSSSPILTSLSKVTFISTHIQLLLGIVLMFVSTKVDFTMIKDKIYRFFSLEHPVLMILAIALITMGYIKFKKSGFSNAKLILIYYGIALLLILAGIPWPFRGLGSGWF